MKLYTLTEPPASAEPWWGIDRVAVPVSGGVARRDGASSSWLGLKSSFNALMTGLAVPGTAPGAYAGCTRLIIDSGRVAPGSDAGSAIVNWGPAARSALDGVCERLGAILSASGLTLCLSPRAGDVLSDVPSCVSFLRSHDGEPVELLLDPASLLTESMIERAEDHFGRIMDALAEHPRVCAVAVFNLHRDPGGLLEPAPLHRGVLDGHLVVALARRAIVAGRPVLLHPDDLSEQVRLIGPADSA